MLHIPMERKLLLVAACMLASSTAFASAHTMVCHSPKSIGGWIGGSGDNGDNDIKSISVLLSKDSGYALGWFYKLVNGETYFQPNLIVQLRMQGGVSTAALLEGEGGSGAPSYRVDGASAVSAAKVVEKLATQYGVDKRDLPLSFSNLVEHRLPTTLNNCK